MSEFIKREAVMKAFADFVRNSNNSDLVPAPTWNQAVDIVSDFPAAAVAPVRHGRWIKNDNETWSCERCHSWIPDEQHYYARFCLYCGAKMDGGDTDETVIL